MKTTLSCWLRLLWNLAPPLRLDGARLSLTATLPPADGARLGESVLDGALTLT